MEKVEVPHYLEALEASTSPSLLADGKGTSSRSSDAFSLLILDPFTGASETSAAELLCAADKSTFTKCRVLNLSRAIPTLKQV